MHILLLVIALGLAVALRLLARWWPGQLTWPGALSLFALPPLLLLSTSGAIAWMGCGWMFGLPARMGSHFLSVLFLGWGLACLAFLVWQTVQTQRQINLHPVVDCHGRSVRLLATDFPYSAQVGLWSSQLVVSQGLLQLLNPEQVQAVLAHEQAHSFYRDTWTFFWLGFLRRLTFWLPETETLWQELLWQRECRADRQATQTCDPLTLAEALALVTQTAMGAEPLALAVPFHGHQQRLLDRIDQLLTVAPNSPVPHSSSQLGFFLWGAIGLLPLVLIPLHIK